MSSESFENLSYEDRTFPPSESFIKNANASTLIEIDGGVTENNAAQLVAAGADVLVAGTTVFKAADPKHMITTLKNC